MMLTAPRTGIVGSSRAWISGNRLGDDPILELLPFLVDHDELGNEHPRLAGPVHDLVVEVVDRPTALAGDLDVRIRRGLKAKSRPRCPPCRGAAGPC